MNAFKNSHATWMIGAVLVSMVVFGAVGCGNVEEDEAPAASSKTITIKNYKFSSQEVTIDRGTKVTWKNREKSSSKIKYNVTVVKKGQKASLVDVFLEAGESHSHVFEKTGTYKVVDRTNNQPGLEGVITVE